MIAHNAGVRCEFSNQWVHRAALRPWGLLIPIVDQLAARRYLHQASLSLVVSKEGMQVLYQIHRAMHKLTSIFCELGMAKSSASNTSKVSKVNYSKHMIYITILQTQGKPIPSLLHSSMHCFIGREIDQKHAVAQPVQYFQHNSI